jgi:hypothetical protein
MPEENRNTAVLAEIAEAFRVPRPDWFCDARHCCECAEHEAELQAKDVDSLDLETVGSAAWEPVAFIKNPEGFKYFMPALARLAYGCGQDYYLDLFCSQLRDDRIATFSRRQRDAVEALIYDLAETITAEIERCDGFHDLEWALCRLRGEHGPVAYLGHDPSFPDPV